MKCPYCDEELKKDGEERYQNVLEHVGAVNQEPAVKPYYRCKNKDCKASKFKGYWGDLGGWYPGSVEELTDMDIKDAVCDFGDDSNE